MAKIGYRRLHALNARYFAKIDSEQSAYILGFIQTDGCVTDRQVIITLQAADAPHLENIARLLDFSGPIRLFGQTRHGRVNQAAQLCLSSMLMVADLKRLGVVSPKSLTMKPCRIPVRLAGAYWRGAFDGNGGICLSKQKKWIATYTGTKSMVRAFARFVQAKTGLRPKALRKHQTTPRLWVATYWTLETVQAVLHALYDGATIYLERKKARAEECWATVRKCGHTSRMHVSVGMVRRAYRKLGTWRAVANSLGMGFHSLHGVRKRLGYQSCY